MKYNPKIPTASSPEHQELAESFLTRFKGKKITPQALTDLLYLVYQQGIEDGSLKTRTELEAEGATPMLDKVLAELKSTDRPSKPRTFTREELQRLFKDD